MIIKTIEIEKFRTIKKSKIELKNIMAIVGENNAGKTTILRAINAVMNFKMESTVLGTRYDLTKEANAICQLYDSFINN